MKLFTWFCIYFWTTIHLVCAETPFRICPVKVHDPNILWADGTWHAIRVASDQNVYLGLSTHSLEHSAVLVRFEPKSQKFTVVADMGEITSTPIGPEGYVPQGKIHTPIFEHKGKLYFGTHVGATSKRKATDKYKPYPGGRFLSYDLKTEKCRVLGSAPEREGLVTMAVDFERGKLYGLTDSSGFFLICDIQSGEVQNLGGTETEWMEDKRLEVAKHVRPCRYLGVDPETGKVYGSRKDGNIYCYDPATGELKDAGLNVRDGIVGKASEEARKNSMWRTIRYDAQTKSFYGVHHHTTSLFRFNPSTKVIEPIVRISPTTLREAESSKDASRLAFVLNPKRVIYHISHGPVVEVSGRGKGGQQAYLISYDLNKNVYKDHGALFWGDRRVIACDSLAEAEDETLFAIAAVEIVNPVKLEELRKVRGVGSSLPFERVLIEISPKGL